MTKQEQFFYVHAGFSVAQGETKEQGRERCARELARAIEWVESQDDLYFVWRHEEDPDLSFMSDEEREEEHEVLCCILYRKSGNYAKRDEVLQSLGNIVDADRNYGRVVEAELASEALYLIEKEERNAAECAKLVAC